MADSADIDQLQVEITPLKQENEKLLASNRRCRRVAGTDDLTGLPDKVFFSTALLPQIVTQRDAEEQSFVSTMVAPDDLGDIKKKCGREGGGRIVVGLAEYLKENLEFGEKLIHIDGANFVIIAANGDFTSAEWRTRQIRARPVSRYFQYGDDALSLTLSLSVTMQTPELAGSATKAKEVVEDLLKRMGIALDDAKKQGRDTVVEDFEEE